MLQECLLSGEIVRKPTSDLLLHLLSNPILRDPRSSVGAILPSFPSKHSPWTSQSSSMMEAQSFTARRAAASSLPNFSLPPPEHLSQMHRLPVYAPSTSTQPTPAIVSSVLTPPAGLASDLSPLASSVNSGSSQSSAGSVPPYQPMGFWPTPNQPSYGFSSATLQLQARDFHRLHTTSVCLLSQLQCQVVDTLNSRLSQLFQLATNIINNSSSKPNNISSKITNSTNSTNSS